MLLCEHKLFGPLLLFLVLDGSLSMVSFSYELLLKRVRVIKRAKLACRCVCWPNIPKELCHWVDIKWSKVNSLMFSRDQHRGGENKRTGVHGMKKHMGVQYKKKLWYTNENNARGQCNGVGARFSINPLSPGPPLKSCLTFMAYMQQGSLILSSRSTSFHLFPFVYITW